MKSFVAALLLPFSFLIEPIYAAQPKRECRIYEMDSRNQLTGRCVGETGLPQLSISKKDWGYEDWVRHVEYCRAPHIQYVDACKEISAEFKVCKNFENGVGFDEESVVKKMYSCFTENAWPQFVPERVAIHLGKLAASKAADKAADELKKRYPPQDAAAMSAKATPFITKAFGLAAKGPLGKACAAKFERLLQASTGNAGAVTATILDATELFASVVRIETHKQRIEHKLQKDSNNQFVFATPGSEGYKERDKMCVNESTQIVAKAEQKIISSIQDQYSCAAR